MSTDLETDDFQGPFEPIAIIGMSCLLPDSSNIDEFWKNILSKHVSFKEIPEGDVTASTSTEFAEIPV